MNKIVVFYYTNLQFEINKLINDLSDMANAIGVYFEEDRKNNILKIGNCEIWFSTCNSPLQIVSYKGPDYVVFDMEKEIFKKNRIRLTDRIKENTEIVTKKEILKILFEND